MDVQQCPMCFGSGIVSCSALLSQFAPSPVDPEGQPAKSALVVENLSVSDDGGEIRLIVAFRLKKFEGESPMPGLLSSVENVEPDVRSSTGLFPEGKMPGPTSVCTLVVASDDKLKLECNPDLEMSCEIAQEATPTRFCVDCAIQFTSPVHRKFHVSAVHENRLQCCSAEFVDEEKYLLHLKEVHGVSVFLCHLCPKAFKNKGTWTVHQRVFHGVRSGCLKRPKTTSMVDPISGSTLHAFCSVCSEELTDATACKGHAETHNGKPQWPCSVCSKNFSSKAFLRNHVKLHTGETPYECILCGRTFTFKQSLTKHMVYHSEERPFKCEDCDRSFRENTTLQNHRRIHTGEKPFACEDCGKKFRQKVAWIVHRRIHTKEAPYVCPSCDRSFRYKVSLRSHRCRGANQPSCSNSSREPVKFEQVTADPMSSDQPSLNLDLFVLQEADRLLALSISDSPCV